MCHKHPLSEARCPTPSRSGRWVYVVCGMPGCEARYRVRPKVWEQEAMRRYGAGMAHLMQQLPSTWERLKTFTE